MPSELLSCSTGPMAPAMVISIPSSTQAVPRATTIRVWNGAQVRRSMRAGIRLRIVSVLPRWVPTASLLMATPSSPDVRAGVGARPDISARTYALHEQPAPRSLPRQGFRAAAGHPLVEPHHPAPRRFPSTGGSLTVVLGWTPTSAQGRTSRAPAGGCPQGKWVTLRRADQDGSTRDALDGTGVALLDRRGVIVWVNRAWREFAV